MKSEIRVFIRRELYELVWSKPLQKLAEEFGISDRGLAKICMRHRMPSPSRGYWARLAAGQKIKRPLYRELNDPSLDRIEIAATVSALPEETRDMLKKAKVDRAERREKAAESDAAIQAGPVEKPHRAIAATARVGLDVAMEALRMGWRSRKAMPDDIVRYAQALRIWSVVRPYLESVVADEG